MAENGRKVEIASDRFLARERMAMFLGQDMPQTIAMKEIIDNEIDIVSERGQRANKAIIMMSPSRLKVMDNGTGISTEVENPDNPKEKPSIWHACATMFSSSNYSNNSTDTIGANGVGMTLANYTSQKFTILNFNGRTVKGYSFTDGFLDGDIENGSSVKETGDFVKNPLSYKNANAKYKPMFEHGFFVDVTWHPAPNELFQDKANVEWLWNYAKTRAAEMSSGEIEIHMFADHEFTEELKTEIWSKDPDSKYYVKSWEEKVKDAGAVLVSERNSPWTFAFNTKEMKIDSICQSAPIKSRHVTTINIEIQDYSVPVSVPFSMKYLSDVYPTYTDQTKVAVRFPYAYVNRAFEKTGEVYRYFKREAEKAYMAYVIKDSDSNMFWPSLGPTEESELIIAEGYSAISGLKSQRDPKTQACIALRGKIQNCWNLDMTKAMRSEVVKQILNAVIYSKYKRIIIAVDADTDGSHICALLLAMFARFTNLIQEGKVFYAHTPHYLFKKTRQPIEWSDDANDCPPGYHVTTLKGLGGMSESEVRTFIMNSETRDLVNIVWDKEAIYNLDRAFSYGGEDWIK